MRFENALLLLSMVAAPLFCVNLHADEIGPTSQFEIAGSGESLTNQMGHWRSTEFIQEHHFAPNQTSYFQLAEIERFNLKDQSLLAGIYLPLTSQWVLNLEGSLSTNHLLLAKGTQLVALQYTIGSGWSVTGGLKAADYNLGNTRQGIVVVEHYFGNFRGSYTFTTTAADAATANSHRLQLSYYYLDKNSVQLSYGFGNEMELSRGADVSYYDTRFQGLSGRHWIDPAWALTWELAQTEQNPVYTRTGIRLGIRHAF